MTVRKGYVSWFKIPWLLNIIVVSSCSSNTSDVLTQMKDLEKIVHDLQAHAQAQEQKQAAVLSSVLSQLTQTTDDLEALKLNNSAIEAELERSRRDVSNLETKIQDGEQERARIQAQLDNTTRTCSDLETSLVTSLNNSTTQSGFTNATGNYLYIL